MTEIFHVPIGGDFPRAYAEHRTRHPGHVLVTAVDIPADEETGTPAQVVVVTRKISEAAPEQL